MRPRCAGSILSELLVKGGKLAFARHLLELQITKSMKLNQIDSASEFLEGLYALGVALVIGNFGTGFSASPPQVLLGAAAEDR